MQSLNCKLSPKETSKVLQVNSLVLEPNACLLLSWLKAMFERCTKSNFFTSLDKLLQCSALRLTVLHLVKIKPHEEVRVHFCLSRYPR